MQSTTDTEVILHLVARARRNRFVDRFIEALRQLEGAYAFVGMTNKKLVGARDPLGIRPLVLGTLDGCPILASETCALDIIGAKYVRDVENGEVRGVRRGRRAFAQAVPADGAAALHLRIHLFRAAGLHRRRPLRLRRAQGAWARSSPREAPADADVIVPVPDSGVPAAIGYRAGVRHPLRDGHHPQPLCRPHLHRADPADPRSSACA